MGPAACIYKLFPLRRSLGPHSCFFVPLYRTQACGALSRAERAAVTGPPFACRVCAERSNFCIRVSSRSCHPACPYCWSWRSGKSQARGVRFGRGDLATLTVGSSRGSIHACTFLIDIYEILCAGTELTSRPSPLSAVGGL